MLTIISGPSSYTNKKQASRKEGSNKSTSKKSSFSHGWLNDGFPKYHFKVIKSLPGFSEPMVF